MSKTTIPASEKSRKSLLAKLNKMLKNSKLTEKDCLELGDKVKESMLQKYKAKGW